MIEHLKDAVGVEDMAAAKCYTWLLAKSASVADGAEFVLVSIDQSPMESSWAVVCRIGVICLLEAVLVEAREALALTFHSAALMTAFVHLGAWLEGWKLDFLLLLDPLGVD